MAEALDREVSWGDDSRHWCVICKKILQEAVQLLCGCRVCKSCVDGSVSDAGLYCPKCREYLKKDSVNYFIDKCIQKEIEKIYKPRTLDRNSKTKHGSSSFAMGNGQWQGECRIQQESMKWSTNQEGSKRPIRQEQHSSTYCGECDIEVVYKNLSDHRVSCWKLHQFNGKSFRCYTEDVEQPSLQSNWQFQGRTMGGLRDGFSQIREMYKNIQDEVMKLRHDMQRKFSRPDSIDDPIFKTMKWKVENISMRIAERCSLLSRSFQCSPNGYNMCLKLEFLGENFLVRLVLLRGENDDNLQWPFRKRVVLSVLSKVSEDVYELPAIPPDVQRCRDSHGTVLCSLMSPKPLRPYIIDTYIFIRCTVV